MNKRYLGAAILSPLIIVLFLGGIYLKVLVALLSLMGIYEFYNVSRKKGINPLSIVSYILTIIYYILIINNSFSFQKLFLMILFALFIMLCIPVISDKYNFIDVAVTLMGFLYVTMFFSFIALINDKPNGKYLIWIIFISAWLCDTSAYYVGKYFGKNKLCPRVSPKKTIEGSIGGLIGSTLFCGIYGLVINSFGVQVPVYHFIFMGIVCGVFCQFGDLVASSIKRYVDVKDYSNLIPGHGGILDRFDSILFTSVIVYYYVTMIMKI
ncbi:MULTISPECIES: phosphatidate cytidylyltransferase [Clostridium]|uniref:Phosphatidate cytidylyltransferase n=1 Tax=Clostridium novyi (strain NT) TaxID=386415 RepID=A0Q0R5_CLONN|nr:MULTISPECIES: phosphatidate cytidylyltransferase [Clostridium]ABK60618.1 phosphatidate cytidylyltransferase [Clostridium novyi NT]KEH88592.1 CDP-diglyceride synthetase [Clostridium novyi A str. NCTC 538]KEH89531.1 CDP-diglyceride synthetase [Clostridium novyi A str. 4540]KEH90694.1 CDP-diglyceride synthetase [Clostridium novyi A str. BKT29909]KEH94488.1 CDP-diglyceride synthetase [Clostridium botulinum C/D str. It1]